MSPSESQFQSPSRSQAQSPSQSQAESQSHAEFQSRAESHSESQAESQPQTSLASEESLIQSGSVMGTASAVPEIAASEGALAPEVRLVKHREPDQSFPDGEDANQAQPAPTFHSWDAIAPEQLNPLLTRQFVTGQQAMLARVVLQKGCIVPEHSHPNEQIAFILSGALRFTLAGETRVVRAGEILVIPADVPHAAEALEDTVDFDIFAPPRQDWLTGDDAYLRQPQPQTATQTRPTS